MIKYRVIRTDGYTEFIDQQDAQNYFDNTPDAISIDTVTQEPEPVIEPIPREVPNWRVRAAVEMLGYKPQVDAFIAQLPLQQRIVAINAWEYGNTTNRYSPITLGIQQGLSLTDAQVDAIFDLAESFSA